MNVSELRIGNLIQLDPNKDWFPGKDIDKPIIVKSISEDGINYSMEFSDIYWDEFDRFAGVPITEEWLLRFGMIQESSWCGDDGYWYRSYAINETSELFGVDCNTVNRTFSFSYDHGGLGDNEVQIKYAHQLQNLYFALTGEELLLSYE